MSTRRTGLFTQSFGQFVVSRFLRVGFLDAQLFEHHQLADAAPEAFGMHVFSFSG